MCEDCIYSEYDDSINDFNCTINFIIDEDDFFNINYSNNSNYCPYYKFGNDYTIVNKQI